MKKSYNALLQHYATWCKSKEHELKILKTQWVFLAPAVFVTLLGLCLCLGLTLLTVVSGTMLTLFGLSLLYLSWRFLKFKNKVERFLKDLEGRVIIGGLGSLHDAHHNEERVHNPPTKKILYH